MLVLEFAAAVFLAFLASAHPAPAYPAPNDLTVAQASQQCGTNQAISCCNTLSKNQADGILGADVANNLLGCSGISALSAVPLNQACPGNNQAACCSHNEQDGVINIECTPVGVGV